MTLRVIEGFDYLPTGQSDAAMAALWSAAQYYFIMGPGAPHLSVTAGRFGSGLAASLSGGNTFGTSQLRPIGASPTELYIGVAVYKDDTSTSSPFIGVYDSGNSDAQITFVFKPNGVIQVWRGFPSSSPILGPAGVLLGSSSLGSFYVDAWFYFEAHIKIDNINGIIQCRVNTQSVISLTSQDTQKTSSSTCDSYIIGDLGAGSGGLSSWKMDDLYVCDIAGSINNTFLGNVRVKTQFTTGNSSPINFTIGGSSPASTNWQSVQNTLLTDAQYVYSLTPGQYDLYTVQPIANAVTIAGVQVRGAYRQDNAAQMIARNVLQSGGTTVNGSDFYTNQTYSYHTDIWELDPSTSTGWLESAVNAITIGPKEQA